MKTGRVAFGRMEAVSFGKPVGDAITEEVARFDAQRVFLMISGTLNRETDEIDKLRRALGNKVAGEFDSMAPHTPRGDVIRATEAARAADVDMIVTFGGGSITDGAKAVQLCLANEIREQGEMDKLRAVITSDGTVSLPAIKAPRVPQITIPTTLSGGEFSAISGVTDESIHVKELFRHPDIIPRAVILDPEPTTQTPEWLFLSTGVRAVDHCVEGVCSNEAHPFGDAQALQGLSLLARGLPRVKSNPEDMEARLDCQIGTWMSMAPLASGVPMGASHGIGYVLGAVFDIPHGHTSCIMLPYVMRWNKPFNADRQELASVAMGSPGEDLSDLLDTFIGGLGMPRSLGAVDVRPEHFQRIAEQSMDTPWIPRNPRRIDGPADVVEILQLAV